MACPIYHAETKAVNCWLVNMPCHLLQVKLIESKLPWIEYYDAMKEFKEVKERQRQADDCLEARKKDFEESQQPLGYMPSLLTSHGSVMSILHPQAAMILWAHSTATAVACWPIDSQYKTGFQGVTPVCQRSPKLDADCSC